MTKIHEQIQDGQHDANVVAALINEIEKKFKNQGIAFATFKEELEAQIEWIKTKK